MAWGRTVARAARVVGFVAMAEATLLPSLRSARAADVVDQCLASYTESQRSRLASKLVTAREHLRRCTHASCPAAVRNDCTQWLGEVERDLPTIVIAAKDSHGGDTDGVAVILDDWPLDAPLGRAIAVDPGPHTLHYRLGDAVLTERIVATQGEKNRKVVADFSASRQVSSSDVVPKPKPPESPPQPSASRGLPLGVWIAGGVAVVGAGSFAYFASAGRSTQSSCEPKCTREDVDSLRRDYLVADISLATVVIAAGAALLIALLSDAPSSRPGIPRGPMFLEGF